MEQMRAKEIIQKLEILSPLQYAEKWDNSGWQCGRGEKEVQKILLAVDATDEVVDEAILSEADLLITHHPLIFPSVSKITDQDFIGRRLLKLLQADICLYAMHTNFDVMGMADEAADRLDLRNRKVLDILYEDEISSEGIGRIGRLPNTLSLRETAELVKETFLLDSVRVYGDLDKRIEWAAISPGSGKKMSAKAIAGHADVLITGDIDHHEGIDSVARGLSIIDAGHFGIEKIFISYMKNYFLHELTDITVVAASQNEPFQMV